jgi:DNA-binding CsgD family transcriptional regulator
MVHDLEEAHSLTTKGANDSDNCRVICQLALGYAAIKASKNGIGTDDVSGIDPGARAVELLHQAESMWERVVPYFQHQCLVRMASAKGRLGDFEGAYLMLTQAQDLKEKLHTAKVKNEIGSLRLLMKLEREEHEKEIQRMKAEQTERELGNTTLQFLAQTELLADLRNDLLKIAGKIPPTEPGARELRERIKRLPCESVDWEKFDRQFQAVHPEFIRRLTERAPDLTVTEVRICTMLRMNLKSHEIAQIFCISEAGVEFHRKHIRKKLKLEREEKLPLVLGAM